MRHFLKSAVFKLASRCNIACKYCYMYELADQSYVSQPKVASDQVIDATFKRIVEYCAGNDLGSFHVSLHGGEPLLAGIRKFERVSEHASKALQDNSIKVSLSVQTNATLLNANWVEFFYANHIGVCISLDGPRELHDKNRVDHRGRPTHRIVEEKVRWMREHPIGRRIFSTVLCVVDPTSDGAALVRYFHSLNVGVDFVLPDQNHAFSADFYPKPHGQYGKFLVDAYNEWRKIDDPSFRVRKFRLLISSLLGRKANLDSLGTGPVEVFVVETNGGLEPVDSFKCCGEGFTKTNLNVLSDRVDDLHENWLVKVGADKRLSAGPVCSACAEFELCGGGYLPHRYDGSSFSNPSVYCEDLKTLCRAVRSDVEQELSRCNIHIV